jgi:hypothetical protein
VLELSRDYIARDPRTGLPIQVGTEKKAKAKTNAKTERGPWQGLRKQDIIPLAKGEIETAKSVWTERDYQLTQVDGVRALQRLKGFASTEAHKVLLSSFENNDPAIRVAALEALPEVAIQKSDEMFDWLSVLLDDEDIDVSMAASKALAISAPVFPSGIESILVNELRSPIKFRQDNAWDALKGLADTWPEVVCLHIDGLLLETDKQYRIKAAKLLKKVLRKGGSSAWDLVSWALNDESDEVRRIAAKTLPTLANKEPRVATLFAERAMVDVDPEVRISAIKAIQKLDKDNGRAQDIVLSGTRSKDLQVRTACINLLPRLLSEDVLRVTAEELLRTETDSGLIKSLKEMVFDAEIEGTEAQKNLFLAAAIPVPQLDREIAESQGKKLGLEPLPSDRKSALEDISEKPDHLLTDNERVQKMIAMNEQIKKKEAERKNAYRSYSQDEVYGYEDDFGPDLDSDDDADF